MSKARGLADLGNVFDDGALSNRNVIVNGDMRISQRGSSFTVTNEYALDRWFCRENTDGALTFSQDSESPDGFSKSLKVNVDTADTSIGSSQFAYLAQRLEGYSIESFAFGGSGAKNITLSFYIRCSVTGKFGGSIVNGSNNNRSHAFTYDVNAANTWERKTIVFDGDTTGTWNVDNTQEMAIFWSLGGGSGVKKAEGSWDATAGVQSATEADTELLETASATWYITGVQLELGDTATPFEHRSYGDELARCQRFYEEGFGYSDAGTQYIREHVPFKVSKRSTPSVTVRSKRPDGNGDDSAGKYYQGASNKSGVAANPISKTDYRLEINPGFTANSDIYWRWQADAEL